MVIRGIRAQALTSLATFVLCLIVVGGSIVVVGFGRLAHVSEASAGVLVLLGLVAISAQAAETARRRQPEIALARLRGRRGVRLLLFAVAPQLLVALLGSIVGVAVGDLVTRTVINAWLTGAPGYTVGEREWIAAGALFVAAAFTIMVSSWSAVRRPLATALSEQSRPTVRSAALVFLEILVVVGAVVAVYEAHQPVARRHEWVPLLSPVIVGLAAGQVVVWVMGIVLAALVSRSAKAGMGWFLTVRRLRRRAASTSVVRTLIGAGVVMAVAFCAVSASAAWREDRARLQSGAPIRFSMQTNALGAYVVATQADPSGKWLLPVAAFEDPARNQRRVMADMSRWNNVVGDFFAGTSAGGLSSHVAAFGTPAKVALIQGGSVVVTMAQADVAKVRAGFGVGLTYVDDDSQVDEATVSIGPTAHGTSHGSTVSFSAPLHACTTRCSLQSVDLVGRTLAPITIDAVTVGGRNLLRDGGHARQDVDIAFHTAGSGYTVDVPRLYQTNFEISNTRPFVDFTPPGSMKVISTTGFHFDTSDGTTDVQGVDGTARDVTRIGTVAALPFLGTTGTMLDLPSMLAGAGGSIPETHAFVLARADTPPAVLAKVRAAPGVGPASTFGSELKALDATPRAQGSRMFLLVSVSAGLVAMVFLATVIASQIRERRHEAASLRVVGLSPRLISSAYRSEALTLGVATFAGTAVAAWIACRGLLARLPLVSGWAFAPPLNSAPRVGAILLVSLALGVVVGASVLVGFARIGSSSPPRLLREGAR